MVCAGLGLSIVAAVPASALVTAYAADQTGNPSGPSNIVLSVPVTAQVGAACATTALPTTTVNLGALDQALPDTQVSLSIQCSGPFRMGLVSTNGGLKSAATAPTGFANLRDYSVALHIKDNASVDHPSSTCVASLLTPTASASTCTTNLRGPATSTGPNFLVSTASTGQASYLLISNAPLGSGVLVGASDYSDTLTITLTAAS